MKHFSLSVRNLIRKPGRTAGLALLTAFLALILLIGSIIMISLGIIGYYIARIYEETKGRPRYIISRKL